MRAPRVPLPGPVWGSAPVRRDESPPPPRAVAWLGRARRARRIARAAQAASHDGALDDAASRAQRLSAARAALRREGFTPVALVPALALAAWAARRALGMAPREVQLMAAAAMLEGAMAEMATGEGKTLATALAAAAAALSGAPVHAITANDYLARRDAERMAPLFAALGVRVAALPGGAEPTLRRAAYAADVVYGTAKDFAFDHLRDGLAGALPSEPARAAAALAGRAAPPPLQRGLCIALLDEADSILLDEAEVPLILSRAVQRPERRALAWQALAIARRLAARADYTLDAEARRAELTPAGALRVAELATPLGGVWRRTLDRQEAVATALVGLHLLRRDRDYRVHAGEVQLLDAVTGRVAPDRQWSNGLHAAVALKEGLPLPADAEAAARTTFQRFFRRYGLLGGLSGTLREARAELDAVYGAPWVCVPPHVPSRCRRAPPRWFETAEAMFDAAVPRIAALRAAGRPVLVGTDSVEASASLSRRLRDAGVPHRVLDALHDADEAAIVATAGIAGTVTVATRMAGRGTDIALDDAARTAGGLHVLACQHNASARVDRQLLGRAARHGEPGSTETWRSRDFSEDALLAMSPTLPGWTHLLAHTRTAHACFRWAQRREEARRAAQRRALLREDLAWDRRLAWGSPSG